MRWHVRRIALMSLAAVSIMVLIATLYSSSAIWGDLPSASFTIGQIESLRRKLLDREDTIVELSRELQVVRTRLLQVDQRDQQLGLGLRQPDSVVNPSPTHSENATWIRLRPEQLAEYQQMLDSLRIYMYDIALGREMRWLVDDKYGAEQLFINLLATSAFHTTAPDKANMFFMPFRCTAYRRSVQERVLGDIVAKNVTAQYFDVVMNKYRWWNVSSGTDHFYICGHDMGTAVTALSHPALVKNAIGLVNTADYDDARYIPHKDISLPPNIDVLPSAHVATEEEITADLIRLEMARDRLYRATRQKVAHPDMNFEPLMERRMGKLVQYGLGGLIHPREKRTKLAYFAGPLHYGRVRPKVRDAFANDTDIVLFEGRHAQPILYYNELATSKFCLFLRGYRAWSPRLMDAVFMGCIPVIISDHYDLPLGQLLDWSEFSITIPEARIPRLKQTLLAVSDAQLSRMQNRLAEVYQHFVWNDPPKPFDAFHMVLWQLWRRRR